MKNLMLCLFLAVFVCGCSVAEKPFPIGKGLLVSKITITPGKNKVKSPFKVERNV